MYQLHYDKYKQKNFIQTNSINNFRINQNYIPITHAQPLNLPLNLPLNYKISPSYSNIKLPCDSKPNEKIKVYPILNPINLNNSSGIQQNHIQNIKKQKLMSGSEKKNVVLTPNTQSADLLFSQLTLSNPSPIPSPVKQLNMNISQISLISPKSPSSQNRKRNFDEVSKCDKVTNTKPDKKKIKKEGELIIDEKKNMYRRIKIEDKYYLKKIGWFDNTDNYHRINYLQSIVPKSIFYIKPNNYTQPNISYNDPIRTISDHLFIQSKKLFFPKSNITFRIGSLNACMTKMAIRSKQGIYNDIDSELPFYYSCDTFKDDDLRRAYVSTYLLEQLIGNPIICVQEIDFATIKLLQPYCNVLYSEKNDNIGGLAIIVSKLFFIKNCELIYDEWVVDGINKEKLIGQHVSIGIDTSPSPSPSPSPDTIFISNFHLDCEFATYSFPIVESFASKSDYIGGDFNLYRGQLIRGLKNVSKEKNNKLSEIYTDIVENFSFSNRIDHIFQISKFV
jgi:hypothetical protein